MNKILLASLISLTSTSALAIEGGTALDWEQHDNLVRMNCTGTIIGGKFVLTADHCEWQGIRPVNLANGDFINTVKINKPPYPSSDSTNYFDMGLWELAKTPLVRDFNPLSMIPVSIGETLKINGFGEAQTTPKQAIKSVFGINNRIYETTDIGSGITEGGDSGSPVIKNNAIVAVHSSGIGATSNEERLNFSPARKFILDTVNGWHYPTAAKTTNGKVDVPIQSLFAENQEVIDLTNLSIEKSNGIHVTVDPACMSYEPRTDGIPATSSNVKPFDLCTLHVEANDDTYGTITVKNNASTGGQDAVITINPQAKPAPEPTPDPKPQPDNGSSGGGSTSILTLIGLLGIALKRKFF